MFITAILFMSGILSYFNDNAVLFALIISLVGIFLICKNIIDIKYIFLAIIVFYIGFFNAYFRTNLTDELVPYAGSKGTVKGQIVSIPNSSNILRTKFFFKVFEINNEKVNGKTFVSISENDLAEFQSGDYYEITGSLKTPFKAGNPSQFDYGKYLKNFDTFTVFYAKKSDCKKLDNKLTPKWKFIKSLNILRDKIIKEHSKYLGSPNLEILGGIVFGDDAVAPPDYVKTSFINSGLLHILAASGMNVAFIYGFWFFFMKRLRVPFKISVISGMFIIVLYTLMTGLGASVIRAALMLILILFGKLIDRDANSVSLLAFVAMLMLLYNPAYINDVGFQLSFIVTFGLLTTANIVLDKYKNSKNINSILGFFLIPIVAQIWVAPIQMFYFNTFSTYSVFANILSVPFLSVVSFGGFLSSILAIFGNLTSKICMFIDVILNYILYAIVSISNFFGQIPHSLLTTTHPSIFQIFLYYLLILLLTLMIKIGLNKKIIISCMTIIVLLLTSLINLPSKELQIITFDVQNADCFLIKTPQSKFFIIDTGRAAFQGGKAQANSIIIKYLKDRGIKNIEGLIITHFDNDHSGGAPDIIRNFKIENVYINSFDDKTMTSKNIYNEINTKHIPSRIPSGTIYTEPDLKINTYIAKEETDNEKSIITLLSYKDFDMLFMGDAGIKAFENLKNDIPINIEVFKVGHHGGKRTVDSNMINYLNSDVSIISTGPNSFGHPNKITLDTLRNTDIYRTDRHNSIKINTNGNYYNLYLFNNKKYNFIKKYKTLTN